MQKRNWSQRTVGLWAIAGAIATVTWVSQSRVLNSLTLFLKGAPSQAQEIPGFTSRRTTFLVVAGGGAPSYNEIALEKNVLYFQRTLAFLGLDTAETSLFFANGNDGRATIRYLDDQGRERFKVPEIENLTGAATQANVNRWLQDYPQTPAGQADCPAFFYFTGHGALNRRDPNNNALILWEENFLSVQSLAQQLDQWPSDVPFVTMMAQCYAGSFANLIYEKGDPTQPVALQTRCGFFATVKTRPSVGCTPLVNEADYRDYSSSFFAGLSGRDRIGNPAPSADYNRDGAVSYAEAHAFAKVDGETPDWPISTSEAWLQEYASNSQVQVILATPITAWVALARPEQRHVVTQLAGELGYNPRLSFQQNDSRSPGRNNPRDEVQSAYRMRLRMELVNIAMEHVIRTEGDTEAIAIVDKLLACEAGVPR
jgi:hypothetical protein